VFVGGDAVVRFWTALIYGTWFQIQFTQWSVYYGEGLASEMQANWFWSVGKCLILYYCNLLYGFRMWCSWLNLLQMELLWFVPGMVGSPSFVRFISGCITRLSRLRVNSTILKFCNFVIYIKSIVHITFYKQCTSVLILRQKKKKAHCAWARLGTEADPW
jgi:hypothetical protein